MSNKSLSFNKTWSSCHDLSFLDAVHIISSHSFACKGGGSKHKISWLHSLGYNWYYSHGFPWNWQHYQFRVLESMSQNTEMKISQIFWSKRGETLQCDNAWMSSNKPLKKQLSSWLSLPYPIVPYNPDLVLCDFHVFPKLKGNSRHLFDLNKQTARWIRSGWTDSVVGSFAWVFVVVFLTALRNLSIIAEICTE